MPCIQSKYIHAHNVLNGQKILRGNTLLGAKVTVRLANHDQVNIAFNGFVQRTVFLKNRQWVKVVNVAAFTWDDDGFFDWDYLQPNQYACGVYDAGGCKLVLEGDGLMLRTDNEAPHKSNRNTNNIVHIESYLNT